MFEDKTSKFVLFGGLLIILAGAFAPNWIVNQFMFGFSRALAIVGLMVLWRTGLVSFGHAFYFGLGAYAVAILDIQLWCDRCVFETCLLERSLLVWRVISLAS